MKQYKSAIGIELIVGMSISFFTMAVLMLTTKQSSSLFILLLVVAFVGHLFYTTDYTIQGDLLKIRAGFLINKKIPITEIKKIYPTNSLLSSPALSLSERICVEYGNGKSIIISPKKRSEFLNSIIVINPSIIIS